MQIISFTYTKESGERTQRVFMPLSTPSENYFGIDVSELDIEDQLGVEMAVNEILDEQKAKIAAVMEEFDIKHNYRTFASAKMTNIVTD